MGRNHKKDRKVRSTLSGKDLTNKEAIATSEALEWVKIQGFIIIERKYTTPELLGKSFKSFLTEIGDVIVK